MKKVFNYLLILAISLSTSISLVSCDDFGEGGNKDGSSQNGGNTDNDQNNNSNKTYKDKEDFQNIALELRDEFKASEFENILDLAEYIANEYTEYEVDEAEEWWEECWNTISKEVESDNPYPVYENIYKLSAFKGKFVAENGRWEKHDSNNLSAHVNDQNGNPCEIALTTSGRTKKVYCTTFEEGDWYYDEYYDEDSESWQSNSDYEVTSEERVWVEVPENITIVLKQNGSKLAEVVIKTDLSSMQTENFNLSKDKYSVSASVYFNGYSFIVENISYANNNETKITTYFKKSDKTLLSANLAFTPQIAETDENIDFEDDEFYESLESANNIMSINILGKLELQGSCSSAKKLVEILDGEWDEHIDSKINKQLKINVFFYGAKEPTAKIEFESFEDEEYYDGETYYTDYDLEPIIEFKDFSRHSLEEFFNEEDFQKTIDAFESLLKEFENLFYGYDFDSIGS